jgi:hypothetical protein
MARRWRDVWLRAGLLHPLLFVAPPVVLCLLLAELPGSDVDLVGWGFVAVPLCALASFAATVMLALRRPLTVARRALVVLLGLLASATVAVAGFFLWLHAAVVACHGGYECPF